MTKTEIRNMEQYLLETWKFIGVKEVFKYKGRIYYYTGGGTQVELIYDVKNCLFEELKDVASRRDTDIDSEKISIKQLIENRR